MLYQWDCQQCGKQVEVVRKVDDRDRGPEEGCELCGCRDFKRALAASAFTLLGGGWFRDGY
jgi:putative FmdB family regulatory protein